MHCFDTDGRIQARDEHNLLLLLYAIASFWVQRMQLYLFCSLEVAAQPWKIGLSGGFAQAVSV